MTPRKLRVLIDLSMAARGYCGIAQDVRLLYKTLATSPDIEVAGLVYHPRHFGPWHRFESPAAARADRVANQAGYLWALSEGAVAWPDLAPLRRWKQLQQLAAMACAPRVRLDRLEIEAFWEIIWRLLFSQTLSPDDRTLVQGRTFHLANLCDGMIYGRALVKLKPFKLDTHDYDFLIVQGPRPFRTSVETRQIVRYHDMIPLLQPDTMRTPLAIKWHHQAVRQSRDRAFFVCNSQPTRDALTMVYPELRDKSATIPYMVADAYYPDPCRQMVDRIIGRRQSTAAGAPVASAAGVCPRYVMCVSTLEPRKNFVSLIQAFNTLKGRAEPGSALEALKLVIVGGRGWKYGPILEAMRHSVARGELLYLDSVPVDEMRILYTHAEALVYPSHYEGFGFPPLEAMQCGTPVIASDIAAHRWVLGDAALYCDPHDVASIAAAIERLVASGESTSLREKLVDRGHQRVGRYRVDRCAREWTELLHSLREDGGRVESDESPSRWQTSLVQKVA